MNTITLTPSTHPTGGHRSNQIAPALLVRPRP